MAASHMRNHDHLQSAPIGWHGRPVALCGKRARGAQLKSVKTIRVGRGSRSAAGFALTFLQIMGESPGGIVNV
jgi:hypothetical protein